MEKILSIAYYLFNGICFYFVASRSISLPIQGDEAGTYLRHATGGPDALFNLGTANNHFLNTLLIKLTTSSAPFSEIAIRLPTVAIYAWFFFYYIPRQSCFKTWGSRLLFSAISLFPYYINEYASMARGYVMSSIFSCCTLSELAVKLESYHSSQQENNNGQDFPGKVVLFACLSTLSSIIALPLATTSILISIICFIRFEQPHRLLRSSKVNALAISLAAGTAGLTIHTFIAIKHSGVGTIVSAPIQPVKWLSEFYNFIWLPISGSAHSYGSSSPAFAIIITWLWILSILAVLISKNYKIAAKLSVASLVTALILLYCLALSGDYPVGRGMIPYWLPIAFTCSIPFSSNYYILTPNYGLEKAANLLGLALGIIAVINLNKNYETRYVNEMRPFYYQYKSLMHYSRTQNLKCLSYGDINDEVLKFYFLNPEGPVAKPDECPTGKKSQYGFMPYSHDNKEPFFNRE